MLQLGVIGRRGDDAHELRPAFLGVADFDDLEPIRLFLELGPVAQQLLVIGEAVIVAEVEAQVFLGRGDMSGLRLCGERQLDQAKQNGAEREQDKTFHRQPLCDQFGLDGYPIHPSIICYEELKTKQGGRVDGAGGFRLCHAMANRV